MRTTLTRAICRFLAIALMMMPFQYAQAGMIGTDQAASTLSAQTDRAAVTSFLSRSQTASELQSMGLDPQAALDRVAAMTDAEVSSLAGKINALPAGGDGLVLLVLVVFFIWYFAFR